MRTQLAELTATSLQSPDDVVALLDHQRVNDWVIEILGVHEAGSDLWVQVSQERYAGNSLIVHIVPGATAGDVLRLLADNPPVEDTQRVVTVMPSSGASG